jgi:DNA polymerase-3 subunit delta'
VLGVKLSELLGQPEASAYLRAIVKGRRFANAYLFHGPAGVGKMTAALSFASAILCEHGAPPASSTAPGLFDAPAPAKKTAAPEDDACGECAACVKTRTLAHPDLKFLFPVSGEEKELESTIAETLAQLRENPYYVFRYEKAASIRLSITRDLIRELAFKPFESEHRVVVVRDADRMREDQYSALLKSLEEPGAATVWILTTARPSRLPATIRSRCQKVRLAPLAEALIREQLERALRVPSRESRLVAALSGGSLARAIELLEAGDPLALRDKALALLEPAIRGDAGILWRTVQAYMNFGRTGRDSLKRMVEFHELWLRDLLRARYGAGDEALVNFDRAAEIRRQAQGLDATEIRRRLMVLEEILRAIDGNVAADVAMFSGMARVAGARIGEGDWPRHPTGRWNY